MSYPLFHPENTSQPPLWLGVEDLHSDFPGEGDHLELKHGVSEHRIQEAAVAFSNADGGVYIVVARDGRVDGVAKVGEAATDIHQAIRHARNPGRYEVRELGVGDTTVLVLVVSRRRRRERGALRRLVVSLPGCSWWG